MFENNLSFDDVLLKPQKSDILSRSEVSLDCEILKVRCSLPIISSPMDTVTEEHMAITMREYGGLGVIHRYCSVGWLVGW